MNQKLSFTPEMAKITGYNSSGDIDELMLTKLRSLHYLLDQNLIECDIKWTLFVTTAHSPCYEALLKPLPPDFGNLETGYNINALLAVIDDTPPLSVVLHRIFYEIFDDLSKDVVDLLHWVLVLAEYPIFVLIKPAELEKLELDSTIPPPTHAFKIESGGYNCPMSKDRQVGHAFFSCRLDHVLSILSQGFNEHKHSLDRMMKPVPILLRNSLKATYLQSPICAAWGKSCCGSLISCVALAEYVHDLDLIELQENTDEQKCVKISIQDGELVRLRYLLLFGCRCPRLREATSSKWDDVIIPVISFIFRHKLKISMACASCIMGSLVIAKGKDVTFDFVKHFINENSLAWFSHLF